MTRGSSSRTGSSAGISAQAAVVLLRVFVGAIWFSNGVAKITGVSRVRIPGFSFKLIDQSGARSILRAATGSSGLPFLSSFYESVVLAHWPVFAILLTVGELAIGVGLLLGFASRLAALAGLVLIVPIWIMLLPSGTYLWEYPLDLLPLVVLALTAAGRTAGVDRVISRRIRDGWPF